MTSASATEQSLLAIRGLTIELPTAAGLEAAVCDVHLQIAEGEVVGLVGESGSGKTMTALAVMGLLPRGSHVTGSIAYRGEDLVSMSEPELNRIRGNELTMVFQEPMTSLNPVFSIGTQISDVLRVHKRLNKRSAWDRAVELLALVGIPAPRERAREYPHSFSGGMRQRAMLAMALACDPSLLVADEPTTALDATIQAEMLELLRQLQQDSNMAVLLISHDLAVVSEMCDRVVVMYSGEVVEQGATVDLFERPQHPYTAGLIGCLPQFHRSGEPLRWIDGSVPTLGENPQGCRFHPRCSSALPQCTVAPVALGAGSHGLVRCARHSELILEGVGHD